MPLPTAVDRAPRLLLRLAAVPLVLLAGACGDDRTGGPRGAADDIVAAAPAQTAAAGTARFEVGAPRDKVLGVVDFDAARVQAGAPLDHLPEAADPLVAVSLLDGVVDVVSYGGQAIRGVSAFRYELDIAPDQAARAAPPAQRAAVEAIAEAAGGPTIFADIWVDSDGRLRRIQVPLDPATPRPRGDDKTRPDYLTVDLFDFGTEVA